MRWALVKVCARGHHDGRGGLRRAARARRQGDGPRPGLLQRRAAGRRHRPRPCPSPPTATSWSGSSHADGRRPAGWPCTSRRSATGAAASTSASSRAADAGHRPTQRTGPRLHHRGAGRLRAAPADRARLRRDRGRRGVRPRGRGQQRRRAPPGGARRASGSPWSSARSRSPTGSACGWCGPRSGSSGAAHELGEGQAGREGAGGGADRTAARRRSRSTRWPTRWSNSWPTSGSWPPTCRTGCARR